MTSERDAFDAEDSKEPAQLARLYHDIGLSTIPIQKGTKEPVGPWKRAQHERASLHDVLKWLEAGHGLAVVLGRVSDGWVCRDFDDESSYDQWASAYPDLAARLPTSKTARGYHVFAQVERETKTRRFDDGELRADGTYVLVPPSKHPTSGIPYRWIRRPGRDSRLLLAVAETGLARSWTRPITENKEATETTNGNTYSLLPRPNRGMVTTEQWEVIEAAIQSTLPNEVGSRNKEIFRFARRVLAILEGRPSEDLGEKLALRWFEQARRFVGTLDPEVTLADFWHAIERIRKPDHGGDPVSRAWELSQDLPTPLFAMKAAEFDDNARSVKLAKLVVAMDEVSGGNTWYLSCHQAGRLVGLSHTRAYRLLMWWVKKGVLVLVERGTKGAPGSKANRYRLQRQKEDG